MMRAVGEMPEWPNGTDSKSVVLATVPRVRIPISPPYLTLKAQQCWAFLCSSVTVPPLAPPSKIQTIILGVRSIVLESLLKTFPFLRTHRDCLIGLA